MRSIYFILVLVVLFAFISCTQKEDKNGIQLEYNLSGVYSSNLIRNHHLTVKDSADIIKILITYNRNGKPQERIRLFKKVGDKVYERKLLNHYGSDVVDTLYVLSLIKKDTTFDYIFDIDKYESNKPIGFDDWKFVISSGGDNFGLTKFHLRDSTFKEEFFYNENFIFNKINLYYGSDTMMFGK